MMLALVTILHQDDLELIAGSFNDRPRKTLDYATSNAAFNSLLAKLVRGGPDTEWCWCSLRMLNPPPEIQTSLEL